MQPGDIVKSTDPFDNLLTFRIISIDSLGVTKCKIVSGGLPEEVWRHISRLYPVRKGAS